MERVTVVPRASLKVKLVGAFLLMALTVTVLSYFSVQAIQQTRNSFADLVDSHMPRLNTLQNMRVVVERLDKETSLYESSENSADTTEKQKNSLLADLDKLTDLEKDYQILITEAENSADGTETKSSFKPVSTARQQTVNVVFELITLKEQRASIAAIQAKEEELGEAEARLKRAIASTIEQDQAVIERENDATNARVEQVTLLAIVGSVAASLFAVVVGLVIAVSVARNVNKLKVGSAKLAGGDFSSQIQVSSRDELGELAAAFNKMSASLRDSYRRLAIEQERDEAILQAMGEGLIATNEKGNVLLINHVAADYLSITDESTPINKPIQEVYNLYDQNDKDKIALPFEKRPIALALTDKQVVSDVFAFYKADGGRILLNVTATPIVLDDRVVGAISIMRDVTKEKEIDRMKTEFISLASHQLRTPLSAIKWFTEMLVSGDAGELSPEQLEFASNIDDSTERMIELVNALLNISRIESGRIMVDPKPTDLRELVSGIVNDLKAKTEERQQTLLISVHQDLPKINLDPRLIGQVYLNLLTNAVKYTPKGGEISVFISKKDDQVISQITDNGYGIPKEQQSRLFQKFFRASNAVKVETDGTGLGLYLIKAVIESSGGKIWFESEEGKGSTFWFSIPLSGMKAKEGEVTLDV